MNVNSLVLILVVFNVSMYAITSIGIGNSGLQIPNFTQGNAAYGAFQAFYHQASQITNATALGCTPKNNATAATMACIFIIAPAYVFWTTILTFGYFLWAIVNVLPFFFSLATVPCTWMTNIFGGVCNPAASGFNFLSPGTFFGLMFSAGFDLLILLFMATIITGRYNFDIT